MRIAISGGGGLIGTALTTRLEAAGHTVVALVRRTASSDAELSWDPGREAPSLSGFDAVVHLAGAPLGGRRWNSRYKQEIMDSRRSGTATLAAAVARAEGRPNVFVSASAVGYYGSQGPDLLTERSPAGTGFLAEVVRAWEEAASPAARAGCRVIHPRFGIVLARSGGALARQLPLFRLGLGGALGPGGQYVSWVSLDDVSAALVYLIESSELEGPVNVTAPVPVTQAEFAAALGRCLHRPAVLRVPAPVLRVGLGREMADELLLVSQRAIPERLAASGFEFAHRDLDTALAAVLR